MVKCSWDHLVCQGVKHVSSPYLNANMMTMSISYISNKNNITLTNEDHGEGPGIARMPKHYWPNDRKKSQTQIKNHVTQNQQDTWAWEDWWHLIHITKTKDILMMSKGSMIRAHNLKRMEDQSLGGATEEVMLMRELTNQVSCWWEAWVCFTGEMIVERGKDWRWASPLLYRV